MHHHVIAGLLGLAVCAIALSPLLITRYGPCWGLMLWKWNRRKVEIWWAPRDFSPPEHAHDHCSTEFTILWARNRRIYRKTHLPKNIYWYLWARIRHRPPNPETDASYPKGRMLDEAVKRLKADRVEIGPRDSYTAHTPGVWGKWLSVRAGVPHKFEKGASFMLWLAVETWREGCAMDLSKDFRITE